MKILICKDCGYTNRTGKDKCPECGGDDWKTKRKQNLKKKKAKVEKVEKVATFAEPLSESMGIFSRWNE